MHHLIRGARLPLYLAFSIPFLLPLMAQAVESGVVPLAGGWSAAPLQDEPVRKAAAFALMENKRRTGSDLRLIAIKHARLQVVAGSNYSMNLLVSEEGRRRLVIAVVWVRLDGTQELTGWHWI